MQEALTQVYRSWRRRAPEIAHALAVLPPRQRTVLVLRYYEALPDHEIAALIGAKETTVRSLAARALAALRSGELAFVPVQDGRS